MKNAAKFRAYPTAEQKQILMQLFGNGRFVYNQALADHNEKYKETGKGTSTTDKINALPALKEEYPFLKLSYSTTLQQKLRDLGKAFTNFFEGRGAYPKFKKKTGRQSVRYPNQHKRTDIRPEGNGITIPGLGKIKCAFSKQIHGEITSATISMNPDGKFYISLALDQDNQSTPAPPKATGIDVNCKDLAVLSNGKKYKNNKHLPKSEKKLARENRRLSRKEGSKKGEKKSNNFEKQRKKVAKVYQKVKNQRLDDIHKMTHEITEEYNYIAMEDLNVKAMVKNHNLAKTVSDASFGEIRRQIEYKAARKGSTVVYVDRFYPSTQICSACGVKNTNLKGLKGLKIREWECANCGTHHDRDVNAACNILAEAKRIRQRS